MLINQFLSLVRKYIVQFLSLSTHTTVIGIASEWPASTKWSLDYLADKMGDQEIMYREIPNNELVFKFPGKY
jgi:hypothetical protein